jgi:hypothetical protein
VTPQSTPTENGSETTSRAAALGPILAGLLLDLVDFATYGPVGIWAGLAVGGLASYWLAAGLGVRPERRLTYALVGGLYCMMPFTAFFPVATVVGALVRLRERNPPPVEVDADPASRPAVEAEYRSSWDQE